MQGQHGPVYMPVRELTCAERKASQQWISCTVPKGTFRKTFRSAASATTEREPAPDQPLDLSGVSNTQHDEEWNEQIIPLDLHVPSRRSPRLQARNGEATRPTYPREGVQHGKVQTKAQNGNKAAADLDHCCPVCLKIFSQHFNLNKHLKIHSGKKYKCHKCDYEARSLYHLTEHEEKCVHSVTYACTYRGCKATFKHRSGVYKHNKTTHSKK